MKIINKSYRPKVLFHYSNEFHYCWFDDLMIELRKDFEVTSFFDRRVNENEYIWILRCVNPDIIIDVEWDRRTMESEFKDKIRIQLPHWLVSKHYMYWVIWNNFRYNKTITSWPEITKQFIERGLIPKENLLELGYPKIDRLHNGFYDKEKIKENLWIKNNLKTILYAPTFKEFSSFNYFIEEDEEYFYKRINYLANNYNIIIKLHAWTPNEKFKPYLFGENVYLIFDYDIRPYQYLADICISDLSSVIFEFASQNKPVILLRPYEDNIIDKNWIEWTMKDIGTNCKNLEDLEKAVMEYDKNPEKDSEIREKYNKQIFKNLWFSSKILANNILKLYESNSAFSW